jgi:hypothetical protein
MKARIFLAAAVAVAVQLSGCGGGSSGPGSTSTPSGVSGVVTPKSVSVVTAK